MLKKTLATALLVFSIPAIANAWFFSTQVKSAGGSIDTPNKIGQVVTDGAINKSYLQSDVADKNVTVTANTGFTIKSVTIGGVTTNAPASPYTVVYPGSATDKSVSALFAANAYTATASIAGGSVTPTSVGNLFHGYTLKRALVFTFAPSAGSNIDTLTGVPAGATADAVPAAVNARVKVTFPIGYTFTAPVALAATTVNSTPAVNPITPKVVPVGAAASATATVNNIASPTFVWSFVSGPVTPTFTATGDTVTFTPSVAGDYRFKVAVGALSTSVTFKAGAARDICSACHTVNNVPDAAGAVAIQTGYAASIHSQSDHSACYACHAGTATGSHPGTLSANSVDPATFRVTSDAAVSGVAKGDVFCTACHSGAYPIPHPTTLNAGFTCAKCHTDATGKNLGTGDAHNIQGLPGCVDCHAVAQGNVIAGLVNDNNGVRAIIPEFGKRSHHITGATPTDAQCAVCHMEGKKNPFGAGVTVDGQYHMVDNKIYLRNADGGAPFVWSGTEHTNMDNFCFSCHDANGFSDAATLAAINPTGTASNPFADTLTNGYDGVARPGVVDVKTAFTTTNASHHAVSGQRYKYRFSTAANAAAWAARTGNPVPAASEIAEGHAGEASPNGGVIADVGTGLTYDPTGPEEGGEATLFEGGKFVSTYIPLGDTQSVADNSTLHCGDCHTVGQWKAGSSSNADGTATAAAIGAHGSANEYLLRNSLGTDAIHNSLTYVCFNCHKTTLVASSAALWAEKVADNLIADSVAPAVGSAKNPAGLYVKAPVPTWKAGWGSLHPVVFAGQVSGYATAHAVSAMHIQCVADSSDNVGAANRLANSWYAAGVKTLDYLPAAGATAAVPTTSTDSLSGNITGIACTNCHNSGLRSGFGGIHGGNNTYVDGLGRTQTTYRFMPGMGNYKYAPPGGWDNKDTSDASLLTINNPLYPGTPGSRTDSPVGYPGASGKPMGGCYTNGGVSGSGADSNDGFSSCSHHGTSTALSAAAAGRPAAFRATYGGGTTGNPTTYEPTVREATAGGTLVTRPLKY